MGGGEDGGYVEGLEGMGALLLLLFFFKKRMKEKMKKEHGMIHKISEYDDKYMNLFNSCLLLASTAEKETKYDMFKHHTTSAHYLLLTCS